MFSFLDSFDLEHIEKELKMAEEKKEPQGGLYRATW